MVNPVEREPKAQTRGYDEQDLLALVPKRSFTREMRVGVFFIFGVLAFFAALFTLTDVGTFRGRYYLQTVVADAGGMRRGDPVQMRGVNIGRVSKFGMTGQGVNVTLEIENQYRIPADSRAVVSSSGLLGGMVVDVLPGTAARTFDGGESIPGRTERGMMAEVAGLGVRADTALARVNALLAPGTTTAVGRTALELEALVGQLNQIAVQQRGELAALLSNMRRAAGNVERATTSAELERAAARLDSLMLTLSRGSGSLERAGNSLDLVLGRLAAGEGTLGKLSATDDLHRNLNQTVTNLNQLIADIRANPKRYLSVSVF